MEWNLNPKNSRDAWHRILISLVFSWVFFGIGLFLDINDIFILSNLFFILVGLLVYMLVDAIVYIVGSNDYDINKNKLFVIGTVVGFLVNIIIFYGFISYF